MIEIEVEIEVEREKLRGYGSALIDISNEPLGDPRARYKEIGDIRDGLNCVLHKLDALIRKQDEQHKADVAGLGGVPECKE